MDDTSILNDGTPIEFGGKQYVVGCGTNDYDPTKAKLCHKLCTYVAISNLLHGEQEVELVTGCPITHFVNKEARQKHIEFLSGKIQIKIGQTPYNFNIASVTVLPETLGAVMTNPMEYINTLVGVIDIGGLNVNGAIYDRLHPIKSSVFTMNEGGNVTYANIKRALNTNYLANYQDYEIPHLADGKVSTVVEDVLDAQFNRIIEECKKYNWHIGALPLIFTGGGSLLLENQIKTNGYAVSKDPVWDNAKGFLKYKEVVR
jgi:hypothetical protein